MPYIYIHIESKYIDVYVYNRTEMFVNEIASSYASLG